MKISLTGTPGTGKTSVAEQLEKRGWKVVSFSGFAEENGLAERNEELEVDVERTVEALEQELGEEDTVVEGHLAHNLPAEFCIVLRTRPDVLRERLQQRDYTREKVEENVESEALDLVLQQAVELQDSIIELDNTGREAAEVAEELEARIERNDTGYGGIDWSEYL